MPDDSLTELDELVRDHPWFNARADLVVKILRSQRVPKSARLLDAGCGWGVTLRRLESEGWSATGLDISRGALSKLDDGSRHLIHADLVDQPPSTVELFDVVLALDVVEHVDDDQRVVENLLRLLKRDGLLIVSVPAGPRLFSHFDRIQGHRRRYRKRQFRSLLAHPDSDIRMLRYWGFLTYPLVAMQRLLPTREDKSYAEYLSVPGGPAKRLLSALYSREVALTLRSSVPIGTSLFAVVQTRSAP